MNGQWLGQYTGTNTGFLMIDIDDVGTHYEGRASVYDDNKLLPDTYAFIKAAKNEPKQTILTDLFPLDRKTHMPTSWQNMATLFPGVVFPKTAQVNINYTGDELLIDAVTDVGTSVTAKLPASRAGSDSAYEPLSGITDWEGFKAYVTALDFRRYIFRGQNNRFRLRTAFHRSGRADTTRYQDQDIPTLHRHLTSRTRHVFDLRVPDQYGALMNLAQHHGFPTPLLDWTYSPFVAAFFAYRRVTPKELETATPDQKVRIFIFDRTAWLGNHPQFSVLRPYGPHFSLLEFVAIENERLVPQQSISAVTNVDDIETYIRANETQERKYLQVIDLPLIERPKVMRELSVMGITAGSLFPGLDGACEELRERFFN